MSHETPLSPSKTHETPKTRKTAETRETGAHPSPTLRCNLSLVSLRGHPGRAAGHRENPGFCLLWKQQEVLPLLGTMNLTPVSVLEPAWARDPQDPSMRTSKGSEGGRSYFTEPHVEK